LFLFCGNKDASNGRWANHFLYKKSGKADLLVVYVYKNPAIPKGVHNE